MARTKSGLKADNAYKANSPTTSPEPDLQKKRKRSDPALTELEVDVNAPEPPSKKAKRLLKKGKALPVKPKSPSPSPLGTPPPAGGNEEEGGINGESSTPKKHGSDKPSKAKNRDTKETRSEHGIWIGNLPFSSTAETLRTFFQDHAGLKPSEITRINLPPPTAATLASTRSSLKPSNKGFAYLDFDSAPAQAAAMGLSETLHGGRRVLIKDATSFAGRPEKSKTEDTPAEAVDGKAPGKRVFVGNLHFDTQHDDLKEHFEQCGAVDRCFVATFEDSGKCKGYGWITFVEGEDATKAVRGYVFKEEEEEEDEDGDDVEKGAEEGAEKTGKSKKPRKWFVNRFHGRQLKLEFGEDKGTRWKKRFGKAPMSGARGAGAEDGFNEVGGAEGAGDTGDAPPQRASARERPARQTARAPRGWKKVDARTINPGAANSRAQRASVAIVESKGKKTTFD